MCKNQNLFFDLLSDEFDGGDEGEAYESEDGCTEEVRVGHRGVGGHGIVECFLCCLDAGTGFGCVFQGFAECGYGREL